MIHDMLLNVIGRNFVNILHIAITYEYLRILFSEFLVSLSLSSKKIGA